MIKLADSSGTVVYENDNKLYLAKKPAQWTTTFLFVTGLLAFILLANGLLQLFVFKMEIPGAPDLGIILLAAGIFFALVFWRIIAYRKKLNAKPVNVQACICIIDLVANNLLDGQQNLLAPLNAVQLQRKMQITSSSPELVLRWDKNALTIVKGNPFSGGIASVEKALILKGIKKA
ncbi:MAG: hypothetical protein ABIO79_16375 [Ferruginibacter sp.]